MGQAWTRAQHARNSDTGFSDGHVCHDRDLLHGSFHLPKKLHLFAATSPSQVSCKKCTPFSDKDDRFRTYEDGRC